MMMMGFGAYGNGGGGGVDGSSSSSSSSNLSALAQPFTVDRSVPKPLVDLTEPPLNWLNTNSLSFDSMPSSNAYGYSFTSPAPPHMPTPFPGGGATDAFLYGQPSDAVITSSHVEAKPYYPSYASPTNFSYDDYTQSLSGLWEGSSGWEYGKKVEIADGFSSKEMNVAALPVYKDYLDQGSHSSKVLKTCEEQSRSINVLGSTKHLGSANREQFDYKVFSGQNTEFMPVEYSRKSFLGSSSVFPETFPLAPSSDQVRTRNHQMPYCVSIEKGVKQYDNSPNDIASVRNTSPGLVIRSAVGSGSSASNTNAFNNVEIVSRANNKEFAANSNFCNTKDFCPMQSTEDKVRFDSNQVRFHLEHDDYSFSELSSEKNANFLSNVRVTKDSLMENSGLQVPHISRGGLNLTLDGIESINCFENSTETLDHYNLAVDSPCWKGARVPHYSPVETSGPVTSQLTKTIEEAYTGSSLSGPTINAVKFSSQKPSEFSLYEGNRCPQNDLAPSLETLSVSNLFRELSHDDVKEGSYHLNSSFGAEFQISDDMEKPKKGYALSKKTACELNLKPHSMQEILEEGKLTSETKHESGTVFADIGMNNSDSSEGCLSHVPLHATEHILSSPGASVETAPAKLTKSHGEELASKICVQMVINTMHNLSELLLFHCANEACVLKEQDLASLKNVVNNLDNCISKNLAPVVPSQESSIPEKTSQFLWKLPGLYEGVTTSRPQAKKPAAVTVPDQSDFQHIKEERKHYIVSESDENISDFASVRDYADRMKDDKMTQAIKKVLSENLLEEEGSKEQILLYKNLWLEAEAELCSISYRARFNRMKIEMDKSKSPRAKDLSENAPAASDLLKNNIELEKLPQTMVSSDLNMPIKLKSEVNDDSPQNISVPEFPTMTTSSHPDDVMARFHILKRQVDSTICMRTTNVGKLSGSNASPDVNKSEEMTSETNDEQTGPDPSAWDSHVLSRTRHSEDVEASVMARLKILKSRIDSSSFGKMNGETVPQAVDFGTPGAIKHRPAANEIFDVNMEPVVEHNSANHTEEKLAVKEFHLPVWNDRVIPSHSLNISGIKLPATGYDSSSSDWEHVLKEELPEQNC